ncbi:MAG: hypothetical protein HQ477_09590 [Chloroflexi bacterium]|nr:hypothetical protein [Chloroflexota bacterium]
MTSPLIATSLYFSKSHLTTYALNLMAQRFYNAVVLGLKWAEAYLPPMLTTSWTSSLDIGTPFEVCELTTEATSGASVMHRSLSHLCLQGRRWHGQ